MVERCALDILPNPELAALNHVQLIVSGVTIASGVPAVNHVAREHRPGQGMNKDQRLMAVRNASENQVNQEAVPKIRVQLIVHGKNLESGVTAVKIVVVVGKRDLEQ